MRLSLVLAAVVSCGCGGEVVGSLEGHSLQVAEVALTMKNGVPARVSVWMSNQLGLCSALGRNQILRNANVLELEFMRFGEVGQLLELEAGSYPINRTPSEPGRYSGAFFSQFDNGCVRTLITDTARGESGHIELDSLDVVKAKRGAGRFDVTFGNGDRLTGTFDAPLCDVEISNRAASCN